MMPQKNAQRVTARTERGAIRKVIDPGRKLQRGLIVRQVQLCFGKLAELAGIDFNSCILKKLLQPLHTRRHPLIHADNILQPGCGGG
jgi:hypothetical protein